MSSTVTFTPLYGVGGRGPVSYLLQLGNFTLLLDCGWNGNFDVAALQPLQNIAHKIDAVLISHPDIAHLGALPYLVNKLGMTAPVYATSAVNKMGQMFLYDAYLTRHAVSDFTVFDLDDVDAAFGRVTSVRYRQEVSFSKTKNLNSTAATGSGAGGDNSALQLQQQQNTITLTAFPAGHLLGGAVWKIVWNGEEHIYASDFNHRREQHLVGSPLESLFSRPALIISGAGVAVSRSGDSVAAQRELLDLITFTMNGGGSVLMPVDAGGRVLELLLILDRHWSHNRIPNPLVFLCPMVHTTMEFARSNLEFMNEALSKSFGHTKDNPYNLKQVKMVTSVAELSKLPPGPKVVLATSPSLHSGPSRELLLQWAGDARNSIVFPITPETGSLAEKLITAAIERDMRPYDPTPTLSVAMSRKVPLEGEELQAHLAAQEEERQREAEQAQHAMDIDGGTGSPRSAAGGSEHGGSAFGGGNATGGATTTTTRMSSTAIGHLKSGAAGRSTVVGADGIPLEIDTDFLTTGGAAAAAAAAAPDQCLIEGFEVPAGAAAPMFPAEDEWEAVTYDEYGAVIDPNELVGDGYGGGMGGIGGEIGVTGFMDTVDGVGQGSGGEDEETAVEEVVAEEVPMKVVEEVFPVYLRCRVVRLDFEGLADVRSVRTLLAHVAPRDCILINADFSTTAAVAKYLQQELEGLNASVHVPQNPNQQIELPSGASFEVELGENLGKIANMHAVGDYSLAWVDGVLAATHISTTSPPPPSLVDATEAAAAAENEAEAKEAKKHQLYSKEEELPVLKPTGASRTGASNRGGVFIGDVRLSDLRRALLQAGISSEFHGGALYCAGKVVVKRRGEGGGLELEGHLGEEYYRVRDIVYGQYHIA